MTNAWKYLIENVKLRRFIVLLLIIVAFWLMRPMTNLILFIFTFTYLVVSWVGLVQRWLPRVSTSLIVIVTYVLLIALLYLGVARYLPVLSRQVVKVVNSVVHFYSTHQAAMIYRHVSHYISTATTMSQVRHGITIAVSTLTSTGAITVSSVISLVLSFFYTLELKQMNEFSHSFSDNDSGWFFQDIDCFGRKLANTFGVILETQFFTIICNTVITTIGLLFMRMPQISVLSLIVFISSLVPVVGAIISTIPLAMVGCSAGGIRNAVYIIIMIITIHTSEAYVLNPKFMSSRTDLPVFYTLTVLLVGEHLFGIWGLIVGVPIFTLLLDVLDVKPIRSAKRIEKEV